jgi:two-component system nitrate/nitrite sensor histidine kinase NarX
MKPKIQLVGGCASSFPNEVVSKHESGSVNDSGNDALIKCGEAGVLLEQFLLTIIKATKASAGIVRVKSPNGLELRTIGSAGQLDDSCHSESVISTECGICGKATNKRSIESSGIEVCKAKYGDKFFGESCKYVLAVPLSIENADSEPAGVVTLFFAAEQSINDNNKQLLQSYADLIRITLKSIWLAEDNHQTSLLDERQSIANEIHDSLAQSLYYAKIRASLLLDALKSDNDLLAFKCAQDVDEALESSQKTVRELVTHFRCQMDPKGLKFALQKLVKDFISRTSIALEYVNQVDELELPKEYELQIFLIVRESLVNVATHSGATIARLSVTCIDGHYEFDVDDNGAGIASNDPVEGHYGLEIMRERALRIGGEVKVISLEEQGTRVQLTFSAPVA